MNARAIRRHPDGSLDVDFYRRRAARLRAQAMRDVVATKVVPLAKALIAVAILAVALRLVPAADGTGWNGARTNGNAVAGPPSATIVSGRS